MVVKKTRVTKKAEAPTKEAVTKGNGSDQPTQNPIPASKHAETPKEQAVIEGTNSDQPTLSPTSANTQAARVNETTPSTTPPANLPEPDEHYSGGSSQWREEAEDSWQHWDWPPRQWRPNSWQRASWDVTSPYYGYNGYEWSNFGGDWGERSVPQTPQIVPKLRSPHSTETIVSTESDSDRVQRAKTGEIDWAHEETLREKNLNSGNENNSAKSVDKPAAIEQNQLMAETKHEKENQKPPEHNGANNAPKENVQGQGPAEAGPGKNPSEAKPEQKQNQQTQGSNSSEKPMTNGEIEKTKADEEKKRIALAAHARYMRFYRNVRGLVHIN